VMIARSFHLLDQSFAKTKRLNFGLGQEFRLTNHCDTQHCSLHNVIADVILISFVYY